MIYQSHFNIKYILFRLMMFIHKNLWLTFIHFGKLKNTAIQHYGKSWMNLYSTLNRKFIILQIFIYIPSRYLICNGRVFIKLSEHYHNNSLLTELLIQFDVFKSSTDKYIILFTDAVDSYDRPFKCQYINIIQYKWTKFYKIKRTAVIYWGVQNIAVSHVSSCVRYIDLITRATS